MDCSLPGYSVHGIFQARILVWVTSAFFVKWLKPLHISLQQFLKRTSLQFSVNPQILLLHQYLKACEYLHACTQVFRAHCSEESKGENCNVHQQMKANCAGSGMEYYLAMKRVKMFSKRHLIGLCIIVNELIVIYMNNLR